MIDFDPEFVVLGEGVEKVEGGGWLMVGLEFFEGA